MTRNPSLNFIGILFAASLALAACDNTASVVGEAPAEAGGDGVVIKESDRIMGSADAPVTIIEYASMTCSHCAAFATAVLPQLKSEYIDTGRVRFIFREFPLDGVARVASALARCQTGDNYFAFVDLVFHNQQEWLGGLFGGGQEITQELVEESLVEFARTAGLGREQAIACMRDPANLAQVDENWGEAQNQYNINSTPGFVINGTTHSGAMPIESFREIIDPLL